jgi:hypothetical protein
MLPATVPPAGNAATARLFRAALGSQGAGPLDPAIGAAIEAERGQGSPLPGPLRADMERHLGTGLGHVRLHTDRAADELSRAVTAKAFTSDSDVFIPSHRYDPAAPAGRDLLAHELTHAAFHRQSGGPPRVSHPSDPAEASAGRASGPTATVLREEATTPTTLRMREPGEDLLQDIIGTLPKATIVPEAVLRQLPGGEQTVFGPFSSDEILHKLTRLPEKPGVLDRMLRPETLAEQAAGAYGTDVYLAYRNDGTGFLPNQGSGTDQGDTAGFRASAEFNKHGVGLSRLGLTVIGMTTPRGALPAGSPFGPESTYQTPKGPYSGVLAADIGVTVSRSGGSVVDFILSAGIDSREWGELVQDTIHDLSKSPKFPWPSGTKPLLEGGLTWKHTIDDLVKKDFYGLSLTGRLELDASAMTGTRRTEAQAGAKFVMRSARVHTGAGEIWVEFSPAGAFARGFLRYNDGREEGFAGVEAGVNSSLMLNVGRFGIGLRGEAVMSTDPAFQTGTPAGSHPTALKISPFVGEGFGMPAGHHGTGEVVFKVSF